MLNSHTHNNISTFDKMLKFNPYIFLEHRFVLIIILFTCCVQSSSIHGQVSRFIKVFNTHTNAFHVAQNEDGSFFIATGPPSYSIIHLMKTNSDGELIWAKDFKDTVQYSTYGIAILKNHNIVITGHAYASNGTPYYTYIMCLDTSGSILWQKKLDGRFANKIIQSHDGGMIYAGAKIYDGIDGHVVKLDEYGNIVWTRIFGTAGYEYISDVTELNDGSIVCSGFSSDYIKSGIFILKLNNSGIPVWNRFYKFNNNAAAREIKVSCDGSIIVSGFHEPNNDRVHELEPFLLKTDSTGNIIWCKYLPNINWGGVIENVLIDKQGNHILNYTLTNGRGLISSAFIKLDKDGSPLTVKSYMLHNSNLMLELIPTLYNGYAAVGQSSINNTFRGFALLKMDQNLNLPFPDSTFTIAIRDTIPFDTTMGRHIIGGTATDFTIQTIDTTFSEATLCFDNINPGPLNLIDCHEREDSLFIPNIFTPNNDGLNETFKIKYSDEVYSFRLTIFNRWGNEVFSSTDFNIQWDGTTNTNEECRDGTYYYQLNLNDHHRRGYLILRK